MKIKHHQGLGRSRVSHPQKRTCSALELGPRKKQYDSALLEARNLLTNKP
jgi:hypothetical protein